jgi:tRNA 2-thiouridine synthesizing protein A
MANADAQVDARGLNCPMPILRAKKGFLGLSAGQVLHIIATDPGSVKDFQSYCTQGGYEMVDSSQTGGEFHFYIRKK